MEKEFEILDHTADVGIIAYGGGMAEAFANAGKALFNLITDLDKVDEAESRDIEVTAPDRESLLVAWLNELIFLFDTENIILKRFEISEFSDNHLKARGYGQKVDTARHELKVGVKAATYHMLKLEENGGSKVQVLFDI